MKTLKEIRDTVIADLDLYEEDFADSTDLDRWIRDGVAIAENSIHALYQDYFLSVTGEVTLDGSSTIDYPSDIYMNKIRSILHTDNSGTIYEIKKSRSIKADTMYEMLNTSAGLSQVLRWFPINTASEGRKIRLTPASSVTGTIVTYYIRNAKRLVADDDVCDIDEFARVIEQHTKTQAYLKDGDPRAADSAMLEKSYITEMEQSLGDMAADNDNELDVDLSHYEESN